MKQKQKWSSGQVQTLKRFKIDRYIPTCKQMHYVANKENYDPTEDSEIRYKQYLQNCLLNNPDAKTIKYPQGKNQSILVSNTSLMDTMNTIYAQFTFQKTKKLRTISNSPIKILDAPRILDDFYLNIMDWGTNNYLAIGLSNDLYIWNAMDGKIDQLCCYDNQELENQTSETLVTAVHWLSKEILAVGFDNGMIKLIDVETQKILNRLSYHSQRVNTINSTWDLISSAGREYTIINHDPRERSQNIAGVFERHTQEVCGLRWQSQKQTLASGANDNMVLLWDKRLMKLRYHCEGHTAAVKAMAWCPWQPNGLATGGGSNDRTIRFWNSDTGLDLNQTIGQCTRVIETGSQVCALQFLPMYKEMISSHGFSKYEIALWKAETLTKAPIKVQELSGHQSRVLHLGLSPDQSQFCSAAGDETLRFWQVNQEIKPECSPSKCLLDSHKGIRIR